MTCFVAVILLIGQSGPEKNWISPLAMALHIPVMVLKNCIQKRKKPFFNILYLAVLSSRGGKGSKVPPGSIDSQIFAKAVNKCYLQAFLIRKSLFCLKLNSM